jgi:hypothetical protein
MAVVTPIRDRSEARIQQEPPHRGRHPEAPDQGELDPRYLEAAGLANGQPAEAPDAGDVDLDHGRSQS